MGTIVKTLYDTDFVEWSAHEAELVRQRRFDELDLENVAEELADLGRRDQKAVRSQLRRMIMHLVKQRIQPEREGTSWRRSIVDARREIDLDLENSPSLRRHLEQNLQRDYAASVKDALAETNLAAEARRLRIPEQCPFTVDQLLNSDLDSLRLE